MKIMFATDDKTMNSNIAKRFGHAAFYLIFDTEDNLFDARVNNGHDDNHSALVDLMNEGVTHFVIGNIGPQAFEVLKNNNSKIYLARKLSTNKALEKLLENNLEELTEPTLKRSIENHKHGENHLHKHHDGKEHKSGHGHKHIH